MSRLHTPAQWLRWIGRNTKRLAVLVLGFAVLGAGLTMLVLPGPGLIVIILGLAILASEFVWAERALDATTTKAAGAATKVSSNASGRAALMLSGIGMIVGGGLVSAFVGNYRVVGATLALAGIIALCTLLPQVQRWLEAKSARRTESA
ncbi:MAG: hypothetical protein RL238_1985 [Actinomycetota bacterium]|jgi:uncharacterized protein (TIGR02611 family)